MAASTCVASDNAIARMCACIDDIPNARKCTMFYRCEKTKLAYGTKVYVKSSTVLELQTIHDQSTPDNWNDHFELVSSSNNELCSSWCIRLRDFATIDYEIISGYSIAVALVDSFGSQTIGTVNILIRDINEKPTIVDNNVRDVLENSEPDDMIASEIARTDEDGDNTECIVLNGNDISGLPALKWQAHNYPVTQWGSICIFAVNTKAIFDYEILAKFSFKGPSSRSIYNISWFST